MPKFNVAYTVTLSMGRITVEALHQMEAERIVRDDLSVSDLVENCDLDDIEIHDVIEEDEED